MLRWTMKTEHSERKQSSEGRMEMEEQVNGEG